MTEAGVALVTGSTSGIGEAIARRLSTDGWRVVLNSAHSTDRGRELAAELGCTYVQADVGQEEDARRLVNEARSRHGRLDVLVNNAARTEVIPHDDLAAAAPQVWRDLYETNVIGPWVLITAALDALREHGAGSVLNISSHAGVRPKGASIPYAVTKAALNHMTLLLAAALGPGVRVNAIAPGLVDTPMTKEWESARHLWATAAPMQRGARPGEIADIAAAVVSSTYLTGEVIVVDGGLHLR